jgi:hypothetical protein
VDDGFARAIESMFETRAYQGRFQAHVRQAQGLDGTSSHQDLAVEAQGLALRTRMVVIFQNYLQ